MKQTPGAQFRAAISAHLPLQIVGTINAYTALLAKQAGFQALYLSGAGVANASYGMPDIGVTNLNDVLIDIRRIVGAVDIPLLVDADTGWGDSANIQRTVREIEQAGAAGLHIEDQIQSKRCGHLAGKQVVSTEEMEERIKAAVDARVDADFMIMARTDAFAQEGMPATLARIARYQQAGADAIFPEALTELNQYQAITQKMTLPILANITEFGCTPLFTRQELADAKVSMALYPLSAFRAMSQAAQTVYETIYSEGSQQSALQNMQTREQLYDVLGYK